MTSSPTRSTELDEFLRGLQPSDGRGLAVHLVSNGVVGDSRVIKSAQVAQANGHATIIIGITVGAKARVFEAEGMPVVLVPFDTPETAASEKDHRSALLSRWRHAAFDILLDTALVAVPRLTLRGTGLKRAVDEASPVSREPAWSRLQPNILDITIAFLDVLRLARPTIVHSHDTLPLAASIAYLAGTRRHRCPRPQVIYDAHECVAELVKSYPDSKRYRAFQSIERAYARQSTTVITVSTAIADVLQEDYRLPRAPAVVTNSPSAVRDGAAPRLRDVIGVSESTPIAVYSGWVDSERGLGVTMRALRDVPETHLAIVANKPSHALVSALRVAREHGVQDRVHVAPYVMPSQVTEYLSSATVGLIPRESGGHLDLSLPTKFREYTHAGLPIVVSQNREMHAEVTRTGTGLSFVPGDADDLARQLQVVIAEHEKYRARITADLLDEYAWERQATTLASIYGRPPTPSKVSLTSSLLSPTGDTSQPLEHSQTRSRHFHVSLGIGRLDQEGQARARAAAIRLHLNALARSFTGPQVRRREGESPTTATVTLRQAGEEFGRVAETYTYVLIEGFEPLFGPLFKHDVAQEVDALSRHVYATGLIATGHDVRDVAARAEELGSTLSQSELAHWNAKQGRVTEKNRAIAANHEGPLFVSTPDLVRELPGAVWLPLVIDQKSWFALEAPTFTERLRVVSLGRNASHGSPALETLQSTLDELVAEGLIQHSAVSTSAEADDCFRAIEQADVVIDDLSMGSYGLAACQAMAGGRLVISALSEASRRILDEEHPIVSPTLRGVGDAIRALAESDPEELRLRSRRSREYAHRWHDGRATADAIAASMLNY